MTKYSFKKAISIAVILILPVVLLTSQTTTSAALTLEKNYRQSGTPILIGKVLEEFSEALLSKSVITKAELNDPSKIYERLSVIEATTQPSDFQIDQYIPKAPLSDLLNNFDILNASEQDQIDIALFTYYQIFSEKHAFFELYLDARRLVQFNGDDLPMNSFEGVIFDEIASRGDRNVKLQDVKFTIKADPLTPTEFVNFITKKLSDMNIRGIRFQRK